MKKMLVVIDMQYDFVTDALKNEAAETIVPYVRKKILSAKENGDQIFFTMDTHGADYMETEEGKHLPVPHCIKGTKGWQILDELEAPVYADAVIEKETFGSVTFADYLAAHKDEIDALEFVGVCTDICVISNVLLAKAVMPNKKIYVDAAGCAGVTPESHDTAINAMKACHIGILNEGREAWRA